MNIRGTIVKQEDIALKVREAGRLISEEYAGKPLLLISVLKGAFIFLADLCREITIPCEIGFIAAKSYSGTESTGNVSVAFNLKQDLSKFHILVVEDILDTGRTLSKLLGLLKSENPLSLKVITLLDKPERRVVSLEADYTLFTIPDLFAVGYGLDCDEKYRNLPYIAELD
ncbi:MAG: hypoxanthine phosphoribosyltransferase [Oscillospiraceae bacterium]|nr:hypoxanthine phosphoribosyltransferase [Oscillospiraceae bacterium]